MFWIEGGDNWMAKLNPARVYLAAACTVVEDVDGKVLLTR
jgi:hypothetical protein